MTPGIHPTPVHPSCSYPRDGDLLGRFFGRIPVLLFSWSTTVVVVFGPDTDGLSETQTVLVPTVATPVDFSSGVGVVTERFYGTGRSEGWEGARFGGVWVLNEKL